MWFQAVFPEYGKKAPEEIPFMPMPRKSIDLKDVPLSILPPKVPAPSERGSTQSRGTGAPLAERGDEEDPLIPVIT